MPGKMIVIEGIDRSGKATQCILLANYLRQKGIEVVERTFPQYDKPFGKLIRAWLRKEFELSLDCIQLLHALDKQSARKEMETILESGKWIICDRYFLSQIAYGLCEVEDIRWLMNLCDRLVKPDLQIIVSITPDISWERGKGEESDRNEEDLVKLKKVVDNYSTMNLYYQNVLKIDGKGTSEEVFKKIIAEVERLFFAKEKVND